MSKNPQSDIKQKRIIAIIGMTGSGKSEAGSFFKEKGLPVLRFGDVIDEGIKSEGLPWTPENNVYYRAKIRKEHGMAAVALKMLPKIEAAIKESETVILDGLYSWEEYLLLKEKFPQLYLLLIYTGPKIRYTRLAQRKDRPFNLQDAIRRDKTEIEDTNKGGPIALADYLVRNESTLADFRNELELFWKEFINDRS